MATNGKERFLIYGRTGWIGGLLGGLCEKQGIAFTYGDARVEDRSHVELDIMAFQPTHVFNAAGVTGRPNVDWCETHKNETIRSNVIGALTLADVCHFHNIPLIFYGSACIYDYDEQHPSHSGLGFSELDKPNFSGSFYSKTKVLVQEMLETYDNVLILRMRMPISSDLLNPRNIITKLRMYDHVVNFPNSMIVLDELIPLSIEMAKRNLRGVYNFANSGAMSHNEILQMYKDYVDPNYTWKNFTVEEQSKVLISARSNNELDVTKLKKEFPQLLSLKASLLKYVFIKSNTHV